MGHGNKRVQYRANDEVVQVSRGERRIVGFKSNDRVVAAVAEEPVALLSIGAEALKFSGVGFLSRELPEKEIGPEPYCPCESGWQVWKSVGICQRRKHSGAQQFANACNFAAR